MDSCRCPSCLSFNPAGARRCRDCGRPLGGGTRAAVLWVAGIAAAGLVVVATIVLRGPRSEDSPSQAREIPRGGAIEPEVSGAGRETSIPSDAGAAPFTGSPAASPLAATGLPSTPSLVAQSPPHVRLEFLDDLGRVLREGGGVHLGGGNVLVWLGLVRGMAGARCEAFGEAVFVSGLAGEMVLLRFPSLEEHPAAPLADTPEEGAPLLLVELAASGGAKTLPVTSRGLVHEQRSGAERLLFAPSSITQTGDVLITPEGALAGLVLGISTEGQGIAAPSNCLKPLLGAGLAWTFEQLRLQTHDTVASSRAELGRIYVRLGDHERALGELTAAVDLDPGLAAPFLDLRVRLHRAEAARLLEGGEALEARRHLQEALRLKPGDVPARRDLAVVLQASGDPEAALAELLYAARLGPDAEQSVRADLLRAYRQAAGTARQRGDSMAAVNLLRDAAASYPGDGRLQMALAEALAEASDWAAAALAYGEAARLDPTLERAASAGMERARRALEVGGAVEITFPKGKGAIHATARLEEKLDIPVIVDTGASMTVITRSVAQRLGIRDLKGRRTVEVRTVGNGKMAAPVVTLSTLALGRAVVHDVDVLVVDLPDWENTEGLIGLNYLNHFEIKLDHEAGRLTLTPR